VAAEDREHRKKGVDQQEDHREEDHQTEVGQEEGEDQMGVQKEGHQQEAQWEHADQRKVGDQEEYHQKPKVDEQMKGG
jgi:hypothetical protein